MKTYTLSFLFAVLVVAVASDEIKTCDDNDGCDETECCISKGMLRKAECRSRAADGESCSAEEDSFDLFGKKYLFHCPCSKGLSCIPEKVKDLGIFGKIKINERCKVGEPENTEEPPLTESA